MALDLLKSGLPIFGAMAWHDDKPIPPDASDSIMMRVLWSICSLWRPRALACWLTFVVLTGLSLWCAYGTTATQLAEKFADQAVAIAAQTSKQTTLDRLREQRDKLVFTETSEEAVETAKASLATATEQANMERARGGCRDICRQREADERKAAEVLRQAQLNRAATIKAADLDAKIEAAQREVDDVERQKNATKEADPQSASMAKAIGADQNLIAALSHAIFAIAIELGSGVGFWLVFGHGAPSLGGRKARHRQPWCRSIAAGPSSSRSSTRHQRRSSSGSSSRSRARGSTAASSP